MVSSGIHRFRRIKYNMKLLKDVFISVICTLKNNITKKTVLGILVAIALGLVSYIQLTTAPKPADSQIETEIILPKDEAYISPRELFKSVKRKPLNSINFSEF